MFFFQYIYWGCDWVVDKAEKWYENCASCLCTLLHQILYFWNSWLSFVPLVISYLQLGCWWPWPPYPASSMFFPARCPSWWLSITSWSSKWLIMMWIWPNQIPHSHSLAHCTCPNFVPLSKNFKALIRHEKNRELVNIIPGQRFWLFDKSGCLFLIEKISFKWIPISLYSGMKHPNIDSYNPSFRGLFQVNCFFYQNSVPGQK